MIKYTLIILLFFMLAACHDSESKIVCGSFQIPWSYYTSISGDVIKYKTTQYSNLHLRRLPENELCIRETRTKSHD